ncbi:MAG: PRTRC system protein C, partial [Actinomycetota bacterium]
GGTPDEVRRKYAAVYPALTNATVVGPKKESGIESFEFKASVGVKG